MVGEKESRRMGSAGVACWNLSVNLGWFVLDVGVKRREEAVFEFPCAGSWHGSEDCKGFGEKG